MTNNVRIGIIGTGGIARNRHIPSFKAQPNVDIVAAADVVADSLNEVGAKFAIPNLYSDYRDMIAKESLDGVVICTPNR